MLDPLMKGFATGYMKEEENIRWRPMLDPLMKGFATGYIKEEENIRWRPMLNPQIHSTKNLTSERNFSMNIFNLERLILIFNVSIFYFEDQLSIEIIPAGYDTHEIR